MAAKVTIATVDHTLNLDGSQGITIDLMPNERPRMSFTCVPGYAPARMAEVVGYAKDGITPLFGGVILQRSVKGFGFGSLASVYRCEAVGFSAYLDWCFITLTYSTDPTLQDVLDDLVAALPAGYGITLDATDYSAVTLAAFTWTNMRASDGMRELCDRTGLVYTVAPLKVLGMTVPGSTSAPVSVTVGAPHCREVTWEDAATPAITTVKLLCGTGTAAVSQTWTTGAETSWTTDLPAAGSPGYVTVNSVYCTVGTGAMFEWDLVTHTLSEGTYGHPAPGTTIVLVYLGQYPFTVTATTGASPEIQDVQVREDVFDVAQGQEIADGLLAQRGGSPRTLHLLESLDDGWAPGQALDVDLLTDRAVDATCLVTDVSIALVSLSFWTYDVTAVAP